MSSDTDEVLAGLPGWAREIGTTLAATSQYVLSGNSADLYLVATGGRAQPRTLPWVLHETLTRRGFTLLVQFDIGRGAWTESGDDSEAQQFLGARLSDLVDSDSADLAGLAQLIERIVTPPPVGDEQSPANIALLVHRADQLIRNPQALSEAEFVQFRRFDYLARAARPVGVLYNPVLWLTRNDWDLPPSFGRGSDQVRRMVLGAPDRQAQVQAARLLLGSDASDRAVDQFADHTSGMRLTEMVRINSLRREIGLDAEAVVDAARSYRVGVTENPWRQPQLIDKVRAELGPEATLESSVMGQRRAVAKSLDILTRSVANLTGSHMSPSATRPRGVLFFAGPTGVGKTELAKQITALIHGSDEKLIRFDMSEFSAEHSADRLIGSPPGYVGHESGGELTNAIRRDPFSVVLFDEIEKADSRVLDKFLQILDDGRLTDSRGETVFFTEAVIIFTSNLGIYVDDVDERGQPTRKPNVKAGTRYEELAERVTAAIKDHFTLKLERPELLNRIGVDNIAVFDFISPEVGSQILDGMLRRIQDRVYQTNDRTVRLTFEPVINKVLAEECLSEEVLLMGGRGIGTRLESVLVNPLARALFVEDLTEPSTVAVKDLARVGEQFEVTVEVRRD